MLDQDSHLGGKEQAVTLELPLDHAGDLLPGGPLDFLPALLFVFLHRVALSVAERALRLV